MKNKLLVLFLMLFVWVIGQETYDRIFHPVMWDLKTPSECDKNNLKK